MCRRCGRRGDRGKGSPGDLSGHFRLRLFAFMGGPLSINDQGEIRHPARERTRTGRVSALWELSPLCGSAARRDGLVDTLAGGSWPPLFAAFAAPTDDQSSFGSSYKEPKTLFFHIA